METIEFQRGVEDFKSGTVSYDQTNDYRHGVHYL